MSISLSFIVLPFVLFAIVALAFAFIAWQRSRAPGSSSFALMMLVVVIWLSTVVIQTKITGQPEKIIWAKIGYLGIGWVGTLWLSFALDFTHPQNRLLRQIGSWISVIPAVAMAAILANDHQGMIWDRITPLYSSNWLNPIFYNGSWFWLYTIYSYVVLLIGALLLFDDVLHHPLIQRWQVTLLVIGLILPWAANLEYVFGFPIVGLDLTPFAFTITGIIYGWILYHMELFNLVPLAHEAILKNSSEGYLILDLQDRAIDINALASQWLDLQPEKTLGSLAKDFLADWPELLELLANSEPLSLANVDDVKSLLPMPIELPLKRNPPVCIEVDLNLWYHRDRRLAGRLMILRDVTARKLAEQSLRTSERLHRLLVDASPVGYILTNQDEHITFVSSMIYQLFGADNYDLTLSQWIMNRVYPEDQSIGEERVRLISKQLEPLPPQEYRLMKSDKSFFWGEVSSVPVIDDQGNYYGLLGIIHDISSRKALELQLERNLAQQTFVNTLLQILYRPLDLLVALNNVLELTGSFLGASRVYLCRNSIDGLETSIILEWCHPPLRPRAQESVLVRYAEINSWQTMIEEKGLIAISHAEEAPEDIAEFMAIWNTLSLVAFPIYGSDESLLGFMGLDYCEQVHEWSNEDLDLLRSVCQQVSGAIAQRQTEDAERRQRVLAEALHDTSSALNSTLNFEEVLDRILSNLDTVVKHDSASIALVDEEDNVYFVRWRGYDAAGDAMMRKFREPVNERMTYRWMILTGEPVIIADTYLDERWTPEEPFNAIRSYAGIPIQIKGKVVGFINLDSREPDAFNQDLFYGLHVFAEQAAVAIENSRLYAELHRRVDAMTILNRIGMALTAGLDMDQIMVSLFEQCSQVLPIDVFYVALFDPETGRIDFPLYFQEGRYEQIASRNIQQEGGVTAEVIRQRRTFYIPDASQADAIKQYHVIHLDGVPIRSYVGVPLILLDQVVGVISMQSMKAFTYTPEQISLLETIATQAAIAVQNARLFDQMKQMAITDPLTLLSTRGHFTTLARNEVERALRYNRCLSVMMVDIDHFKRVNDTYGHRSGDVVLQEVARITRQALRATDLIGRWGGEEFVLVLPEADPGGALMIAERVRRMVAETQIRLPEATIQVTVSIGVASLDRSLNTLDALVDCADRAMYMAKQSGRNQVRSLTQ